MDAYCVKCRLKRDMKNPKPTILKNGRPATHGTCPICGTKMYRIGKHEEGQEPVITKNAARSLLQDVPEDKVFLCCDGRVFKNMSELASALKEMSGETFCHHVREDNNDFSNWIEHVIGDKKLATDLRQALHLDIAEGCVAKRVTWLEMLIAHP